LVACFFAGAFFFGAVVFFVAVEAFLGAFLFDFDVIKKTLVQPKAQKCNPSFCKDYHIVGFQCMYTGFYETDLDKIALCVESIKSAKEAIVDEEGIGSDLNINIFAWKKNELAVIAQLKNTHTTPKHERLDPIVEASCIMRKGWGIDEFTLVAEGYCSLEPAETQGENLAQLFSEKDSPVTECISFTHLKPNDHTFVAVPYEVKLGRKVNFGSVLWYPGGQVMRDIEYPAALKAALKLDAVKVGKKEDRETYFGTIASGVMNCGFEIFYRDDL